MIKLFVMFYKLFHHRTQNLPFNKLLFNNLDYLPILNIINAVANIFTSCSTVNSLLGPMKENVQTALAIALALAMPKDGSLAIAVLAKEWIGMPFLSEILSENLTFSSVFLVRHSYH